MTARGYFHANDGKVTHFVCARDLEHAKAILDGRGIQLHCPAGVARSVYHPAANHPTMWIEIDKRRATNVKIAGKKLADFRLGEHRAVVLSTGKPTSNT